MKTRDIYKQFTTENIINSQTSWCKWHLMDMFKIDYREAENILFLAVENGFLEPEDYYHRFIVIN